MSARATLDGTGQGRVVRDWGRILTESSEREAVELAGQVIVPSGQDLRIPQLALVLVEHLQRQGSRGHVKVTWSRERHVKFMSR